MKSMDSGSEKQLAPIEQRIAELASRIYRLEQLLAQVVPARPAADPRAAEVGEATLQSASAPGLPVQPASSTEIQDEPPGPLPTPARPSGETESPGPSIFGTASTSQASRSLENIVGGTWLNRLGILAVLVGVSYFLKLAFEEDWIGSGSRILIGLLCGVGLLLWSERFRSHGYAVFSYSLKAIGLGTLYLSLWASSQFYHLVPPDLAFAGMVAVTLTSATLALAQNSEILAAGALLGGFLTPVLISTGQNQEVALLSYLFLLDVGTFWVVSVKRWIRLLPAAFVGTALLSAAWASAYYDKSELATTLVFGTLFFLLFAMTPFLRGVDAMSDTRRGEWEAGLLAVANAVAYFGILFLILWRDHRDLLAWFLFAAAAFYFGLRGLLQRKARSSVALDSLFWGLVIAFTTVGMPVANEGRWITLAWDAEAGVLLWIAYREKTPILRLGGSIVLALAVLRLITDGSTEMTPLFNTRFGLYLLTIAVAALLARVSLRLEGEESRRWAGVAVVLINVLALVALTLELRDFFVQILRTTPGLEAHALNIEETFSYSALWIIYGAALMTIGFIKREAFLRWQAIVLLCAAALKVFFVDISTLNRGYRIVAFIALGIVLLAVSFFYQRVRTSDARQ